MTRWLILFLWLFTAKAVIAETVPVRTGQHAGFTRIVFPLASRTQVDVSQEKGRVILRFGRGPLEFDTSESFRRIDGRRIRGIKQTGPDTLSIDLNCRCGVESFWFNGSSFVVDLAGDAPLDFADEPTRSSRKVVPFARLSSQLSFGGAPKLIAPVVESSPAPASSQQTVDAQIASQKDTTPVEIAPNLTLPSDFGSALSAPRRFVLNETVFQEATARKERVNDAEQQLLRQLSRAATMGLLTPSDTALADRVEQRGQEEAPDVPLPDPEPVLPATVESPRMQLRAKSSMDRDLEQLAEILGGVPESECLPASVLDIARWGDDRPFADQISEKRQAVVAEFDEVTENAQIDLARQYLFFGFGPEAQQAIAGIPPDATTTLLSDIAHIMEHDAAPAGSRLRQEVSCAGPNALLAVLSIESLPFGETVNESGILSTFGGLPSHLRLLFAPRLNRRFLEAGRNEAAASIIRMTDRGRQENSPDLEFAKAQTELGNGEKAKALPRLDAISSADAEVSPDAMLQYVGELLGEDGPIPSRTVSLLGVMSVEQRGTKYELELRSLLVRSLARNGVIEEAFSEFASLEPAISETAADRLKDELLGTVTDLSPDPDFLLRVLPLGTSERGKLTARTGNAIASRLIGLGFHEAAQEFIPSDVPGEDGRERRVLRSTAFLAGGSGELALAELMGLEGEQVERLRADAFAAIGDHAQSSAILKSLDPDAAVRAATRANDWRELADTATGPTQDFARLLLEPEPPDFDLSQEPLARSRALLQQSEAARATLQQFVNGTAPVSDN